MARHIARTFYGIIGSQEGTSRLNRGAPESKHKECPRDDTIESQRFATNNRSIQNAVCTSPGNERHQKKSSSPIQTWASYTTGYCAVDPTTLGAWRRVHLPSILALLVPSYNAKSHVYARTKEFSQVPLDVFLDMPQLAQHNVFLRCPLHAQVLQYRYAAVRLSRHLPARKCTVSGTHECR